jgi:patatin-like phospholipase/acyl hydrolase
MRRILSIDGGGIRGSLTACILVALEEQVGQPCSKVFDMVAGTSTGALIASAIAAGLSAENILSFYAGEPCKEIFNVPGIAVWPKRLLEGYAFDSNNIVKVLQSAFGAAANWTLNDSPLRILLTARGVGGHTWYFVQDRPNNAKTVGGASLVQCVAASAAAPTYFSPVYVSPANGNLIGWCFDGGVGDLANPVYQACVEAFVYDDFKPTPDETQVISLGTGYYCANEVNPPKGFIATLSWTLDSLLTAAGDQQTEIVNRHYPGILQRFNWRLPKPIDEADVSAIPELIAIGKQGAAKMDWKKILQI